jgi:hypothetical protein
MNVGARFIAPWGGEGIPHVPMNLLVCIIAPAWGDAPTRFDIMYMELLMGDDESERPQEDFEVEISDLDQVGATTGPAKPLRSVPLPRFSPRQRRLQLAFTTGIVVLAILTILGSTAPVRELVGGALSGPTPTPLPALVPGTDLFYIQAGPSWGHLSIDGHAVSHLPAPGVDLPLHLSRGRHTLVWRAYPFSTQSCTLTVPANSHTDTCHFDQAMVPAITAKASIIKFSESLNRLSNIERAALIQATQQALERKQYSEIVQPGELYALSSAVSGSKNDPCKVKAQVFLCYVIAEQPLRARLSFPLDLDTSPNSPCSITKTCLFEDQDCRLFCDVPRMLSQTSSPAAQVWKVIVVVRSFWQYETLGGQIIASNEADAFMGGLENEHFVPLLISRDSSGWHVSPLFLNPQAFFGDPVCDSALEDAQIVTGAFLIKNVPIPIDYQSVASPNLADGCVVVMTPQPGPGMTPTSPTTPTLVAYCLHRFGVLLAANNVAHHQWPYLPVANAREKQLAQQLVSGVSS